MSQENQRTYRVVVSEANYAALKVFQSIANGAVEITVIRGEVAVIKPSSQRIDLQRPDERSAIINGDNPGACVDMTGWLGSKVELEEVLCPEPVVDDETASE